jgi:peroxiredoxin
MKAPLLLPVALAALMMMAMSATNPKAYTLGDIAEDFSLKSVNGDTVSLSDYRDANGVIVVFTCNHCPFAQLYEQRIIDLHRNFAPQGFPVVAINPNSPLVVPDDSFEKMQERARSKRYPFAYLFDEAQTVYPRFGATRTPHVFVLDANRIVRYIGSIDNNAEAPNASTTRFVENAIHALIRGEKPSPDYTRAIGCTIKKAPKPVVAPVQVSDASGRN